jgi:dihydrofolate reductase
MRSIIASEFVTLDGVMEDPRWTFSFPPTADYLEAKSRELFSSEALLLGRVTYEGFAAAWPTMQRDPSGYAERMNSLPKYIVSNTLKEARWNNSTILVSEQITGFKNGGTGTALIFGSGTLVDSLGRDNLVDEYNLWVYPQVLGKGKRLFMDGAISASLKLLEARSFESGVLLLRYGTLKK